MLVLGLGSGRPSGGSGVYIWGGEVSGVAIIAAGGTDLHVYCHSEPPLTSGKLCFIINFIGGGHKGCQYFYWGAVASLASPL